MSHTLVTFDGRKISFPDQYLPVVEDAMRRGTPVEIGGVTFKGTDVRRVEKGSDTGEYGPHGTDALEVFRLEEGTERPEYAEFFWKKVLDANRARAREGKPHLYPAAVTWAVEQLGGVRDAAEIRAFLDAEPEAAAPRNRPALPQERPAYRAGVRAETAAFFAAEEGREYAARWAAYDRAHAGEYWRKAR